MEASKKPSTLINRAACKKALLLIASTKKPQLTRVGKDVYDYLDSVLLNHMKGFIHEHPSVGKTICMGVKKRTIKDDYEQ